MREAVRLMRELWAGERVTFEGDYYRTVNATVYDRPEQPVPVYVAAGGPVVAKYAGRAGRRVHLHQRQGHGALHRQAAAGGRRRAARPRARTPAGIDRMIEIKLSYDPTATGRSRTPASGRRSR